MNGCGRKCSTRVHLTFLPRHFGKRSLCSLSVRLGSTGQMNRSGTEAVACGSPFMRNCPPQPRLQSLEFKYDMDDELHQRAVEIAKRILADSSQIELHELGVAEGAENSHLFSDLVELAKQLLREEEFRRTYRDAA